MKDHEITLTIDEIELDLEITQVGQPHDEIHVRPDDELVQRAAQRLIDRRHDELEEICYELHENRREARRVQPLIDELEDAA